jgi:hypothetical protein
MVYANVKIEVSKPVGISMQQEQLIIFTSNLRSTSPGEHEN